MWLRSCRNQLFGYVPYYDMTLRTLTLLSSAPMKHRRDSSRHTKDTMTQPRSARFPNLLLAVWVV